MATPLKHQLLVMLVHVFKPCLPMLESCYIMTGHGDDKKTRDDVIHYIIFQGFEIKGEQYKNQTGVAC